MKTFCLMLALTLFPASLSAAKLLVVTGSGEGAPAQIRVYKQGVETINIKPYNSGFRGGVRVAVGDVNGDGVLDVIAVPGPGMEPVIGVFNGDTGERLPGHIGEFLAYSQVFRGGLFVASGDVNGDGKDDIIVAPDARMSSLVRVFDGNTGNVLRSFLAYATNFNGGVRVAAGDVNGDGLADIITGAGPGGGPHVRVFDGSTGGTLRSFFAFSANFAAGIYVAAGDVNGDGKADIITGAGQGAGPQVNVFDGGSGQLVRTFFTFATNFKGGVRVAAGDVNGDGKADVINGAGPTGVPQVRVQDFLSQATLHNFFAYDPGFRGGIFVAGSRR
jgi:hypothetical protein